MLHCSEGEKRMNHRFASGARGRAFLTASAVCAAALALASPLVAARQADGEAAAYSIERKFEKDGVDRYRLTLNTNMNGPVTDGQERNIKAKLLLRQKVKEVKTDGTAVLDSEFEQGVADIGDMQEMDILFLLPRGSQTISKAGVVLASRSEGGQTPGGSGGDVLEMLARAQRVFMPNKPVKVGDKWKFEHKSEKDKSRVTGEAAILKIEKVGDIETLLIKAIADMVTGADGGGKSHFEGTANLDPKTGKMVKMSGTMDSETGVAGRSKTEIQVQMETGRDAAKPEKKEEKPAP